MERQELKSSTFSFDALSRFRTTLMGLAALNVMLLHISQNFELLGSDIVFTMFESGADMFMLLSGFGLFYSVDKGFSLPAYIKKRFMRIYPEYFLSCALYAVLFGTGVLWFIKYITTAGYWMSDTTLFWFYAIIVVLYIFYPVIHKIIKRSDTGTVILIISIIAVEIILSCFVDEFYWEKAIALERIPVFIAGALIAKRVKYGGISIKSEKVLYFVIGAMASILLTIPAGRHYRFVLLPWSVCITVITAFIFTKCKSNNLVVKVFNGLGKLSLQIYLLHSMLTEFLITRTFVGRFNTAWGIVVTTVFALASSILMKMICDRLRQMSNIRAKKAQ